MRTCSACLPLVCNSLDHFTVVHVVHVGARETIKPRLIQIQIEQELNTDLDGMPAVWLLSSCPLSSCVFITIFRINGFQALYNASRGATPQVELINAHRIVYIIELIASIA